MVFSVKKYQFIIDDEDWSKVQTIKWYILKQKQGRQIYLVNTSREYSSGKTINIRLHRFILGITDRLLHVDHINGNTLDNRKQNLRICSPAENARNSKVSTRKDKTTKFKGVRQRKDNKKFQARIRVNRKLINLGHYDKVEDAAKAYMITLLKNILNDLLN
jgi:hypothetical protein